MNKYLIEILTALAIVIIVLLLVRMYSLENTALEITGLVPEPAVEPEALTETETPVEETTE